MKLPNRNQVLIAIGLLAAEGPDVASVAAWLTSLGIPRLIGVIHFLGFVSAALGGLALAWPSIRTKLALLGLATPPGAQAPWNPGRDGNPPAVAPLVSVPGSVTPPAGTRPSAGYPGKGGALLVFLISAMLTTPSCAWWQKHGPQVECAAMATVENAPQLVAIIEGCVAIVVTPAAIPACVSAAAASQWTADILACFEDAAAGKVSCPAFVKGQVQLKAMRASQGK